MIFVEGFDVPSNRITRALDRALGVLGQSGVEGVFEELILAGIKWEKDDDSVILEIEEYLKTRFEKGANYLISRFRDELQKEE